LASPCVFVAPEIPHIPGAKVVDFAAKVTQVPANTASPPPKDTESPNVQQSVSLRPPVAAPVSLLKLDDENEIRNRKIKELMLLLEEKRRSLILDARNSEKPQMML
jgi:hypothetical protein